MNSSGEIVVVENTEVPTGPNAGSGVDDPLFQSESFRTPTHTAGIFNPSSAPSSVRDLYGNLGASLINLWHRKCLRRLLPIRYL
jgi:hypothetical protein